VFREGNNVLGINACQNNRPPALIKYLVDPLQPADIFISNDGLSYVVCLGSFRLAILTNFGVGIIVNPAILWAYTAHQVGLLCSLKNGKSKVSGKYCTGPAVM